MKKILVITVLILSFIGCEPVDLKVEYSQEIEAVNQIAKEVDVLVEKEVEDLKMLSLMDSFKSVDEDNIMIELETLCKNKPIVNAYFATDQDDMFIYPYVELPEDYSPSIRPWFVNATERGTYFATYSANDSNVTTIAVRGDVGVLSADYITFSIIDSVFADEDVWFTEKNQIIQTRDKEKLYPFNDWAGMSELNQMIYDKVFEGELTSIFELDKKIVIIAKTKRDWSIIKIIEQ